MKTRCELCNRGFDSLLECVECRSHFCSDCGDVERNLCEDCIAFEQNIYATDEVEEVENDEF